MNNEFIFQRASTKATKFTKNEILVDLQAFAKHCRKNSFTTRDYDKWKSRRITSGSITKIFGSWSKAMQEAGLKSTKTQKYNNEELIETYKNCWIEQKSEPTRQQLTDYLKRINSPFTIKSYTHYFGSLGRLADRIIDHQNGKISKEQLLEKYKQSRIRKPIPSKLRYSIIKRDNFLCVLCGASPRKDNKITLEVDHLTPVAKGGTDDPENLRTLCQACNQGKKDSLE